MILRRVGSKKRLAKQIIDKFVPHQVYIESFFGAGGVFFEKPLANHNFVNDIDDDVFNLWFCYTKRYDELYQAILTMPKSESLFKYWLKNTETDPILKALRFLMLSNFSLYGTNDTFRKDNRNEKEILLKHFIEAKYMLNGTSISNCDFRKFFQSISWSNLTDVTVMCYNDPPYLGTGNTYSHSFTEQDSIDLFDINCNLAKQYPKYFFAYSEFDHPFILDQAKQRNLNVIELGERQNIKNRRTEILVTNYKIQQSLFN
jgi:DNA adenine methylase